ncbi:MAG TPA: metallophosphoesterase [Candidatus Mediterraneibacter tabaqchaliae]|uniref:Metallophosphoesterase n=1 Tax=Candidatus Mediterraneibacter tabaqchaliae TaxID=2838689 RepID=A0A9D2R1U5_9FIRM|nr:metallophosphoesterase [Candidatus Mediterraneibacter tabaqchaliae]
MKKVIKILVIILSILILACLASIWVSYNWLTVSHFTVQSSKISEPFRIVLISDLHEHQFGRGNEKLAEKIREQSPDLIIIDGDMINGDSENADTAVELVRALKETAPVYYSFGNHEYSYMEAGHGDLTEELEAAGAVVLNYQSIDIDIKGNPVRLGGLYEYGFETGMQSEEENERAVPYLEEYADTDRYLIMCAHRPESFYPWDMADQWGIDLVLSGHLHGGQVIIPGVGGLYNSLDGFFPKFDYGQYKLGDSDMVITRGLGSNPKMLPRFNNPPEIAVVEVK